jgi:hypothetical protein
MQPTDSQIVKPATDESISSRRSLSEFHLSVRARNCLNNTGIERVGDLVILTEYELLRIRNLGVATLEELKKLVASLGLSLGMGEQDFSIAAVPATAISDPLRDILMDATGLSSADSLTTVEDLPLQLLLDVRLFKVSARAQKLFKIAEVERIGDLVIYSESDLWSFPNVGQTTLNELKKLVGELGLRLNMKIPSWRKPDANFLASQRTDDLETLRQDYFEQLYQIDSSGGVELEITSALTAVIPDGVAGRRPMVLAWMGLKQKKSPTLEVVGIKYGVTREWMRQIVKSTETALKLARFPMKQLRAAFECIEQSGVIKEEEVPVLLHSHSLHNEHVSFSGLLKTAKFFGISCRLGVEVVDGKRLVGLPASLARIKRIRKITHREISSDGCATVAEILSLMSDDLGDDFDGDEVRKVLINLEDFAWLDEKSGWFWISGKKNSLLTQLDKILAVSPQVGLPVLREAIGRSRRMDGFSPPTGVLKALCEQLDDCEVVGGDFVVDKRPRLQEKIFKENELKLIKVFQQSGPVLTHPMVHELCIQSGMNGTTVNIYLGDSPVIHRIAYCVYTLVGAKITPGLVAAAKNGLRKHSSIQ